MSSEKSAPEWPWPPASDHQATYDLHCHCGTIRYTMTVSPPLYAEHTQGTEQQYTAVECTCSWCQRNGEIMAHPLTKNVSFDHGAENRSEYRFGSRIAPHWVCKTCGSTLGADLGPMLKKMGMEERLAINLRMLRGFDRSKLKIKPASMMEGAPPNYKEYIDGLYAQNDK